MAKDCPFPPARNNWRKPGDPPTSEFYKPQIPRAGAGRIFTGGLGGTAELGDESDDEFIPVKPSRASNGSSSRKPSAPEKKHNTNVYDVLALSEEEEGEKEAIVEQKNQSVEEPAQEVEKLPEDIQSMQEQLLVEADTGEEITGKLEEIIPMQEVADQEPQQGAQNSASRSDATNGGEQVALMETEVSGTLVLQRDQARHGERRARSYFKMRASLMDTADTFSRAKEVWEQHPAWARDPRKRWVLALGRLRQLLMEELDKQDKDSEEVTVLATKLHDIRIQLHEDPTSRRVEEMEVTLNKLRRREKIDAHITRVRCRIRWLHEGEAPSKFFFASWKSKIMQESITTLKVANGNVLTDAEEILQEVQEVHSNLYTNEVPVAGAAEKRQEVLQLIDRRLSQE
ncbi:hypothetical protein R1sor_015506 [Riccia sorocarpa]|uniref:Uncharacterized protein n=1 Tax=Riccia sorocarpa TaxID=122646 RepID=A0ABD3HF49_9MARC